jgi:hypothetical protein
MKILGSFCRLLLDLARELSGEAAYRRHLAYHHRTHSREEWRRFADERLRDRYTRPKCC